MDQEILKDLLACVTGDEKGEFLPLDDTYENLQAFYREEVHKKLSELDKSTDLSGYTFEPNSTFFICDGLIDMHPFSKKDIDILLETKVNPYTDKKFSEEGLQNLRKIKEYFGGKFTHWGGLLELLESLDGNKELDREDIEILKQKLMDLENAKTQEEICANIDFFVSPLHTNWAGVDPEKNNYLTYMNSPLLDGIHLWCAKNILLNKETYGFLEKRNVKIDMKEQIENGYTQTIKVILEMGLFNKKDIKAALFLACKSGRLDMVKLFFEKANIKSEYKNLALKEAVSYSNIVKFLLENGATDSHGRALGYACSLKAVNSVRFLLEKISYPENILTVVLNDTLEEAEDETFNDIAFLLVEHGARITGEIFITAVDDNNTEFVQFALQNTQFPQNTLNRALSDARNSTIQEILIEAGAVSAVRRRQPSRRERLPSSDSDSD